MSANVSKIDIILNAAEARQEAARLDQSMQGIAKSAQTAGVQATAGLNQIEAQIVRSASSTRQYTADEIARTRAVQQAAAATADASLKEAQRRAALFNEQVALKEAAAAERGRAMSAEQTEAMLQRVAAATRAATQAAREAAIAQEEQAAATMTNGEAAAFTTRQQVQLAGAASRMAGAAIPGARAIGLLAGSFSLAAVPQLALIIGAGILVGKLLELARAKDVHIELNDKLIAQDIVMAQTAETAAERASKEKVVRGDMIAILSLLIDHSQKYTKAVEDQKRAQLELTFAQIRNDEAAVKFGDDMGNLFVPGVKGAGQDVAKFTEEMQKNQAELDKNITSIVKFANETGKANDVIIRQAQEMGADAGAIKQLTDALNSATRAQQQWQAALDEQTIPAVNLRNTTEGEAQARKQLIERIQGQIAAGKSLRDIVEANRSALEAELHSIQHGIDLDVAAGKVKGTHAAMQAELTRRIAEGHDGLEKYLAVVKASDEAHKHWTNSTDKAAAAAKALAIATAELQKQLEQSQAGEGGKTFAGQATAIQAAIEAKRTELAIKTQLTRENALLLTAIEMAQLTKVNNEHVKAREAAEQRIAQINVKTIVDEYDRHRAAIATQATEDHKAFVALGLDEVEVYTLTIRAKQERADEFMAWFIERNRKMADELTREGARFEHQLNTERAKEDEAFFKESLRGWEQHEKEIQALIQHFGRSKGSTGIFDVNQLDATNNRLKALGITVQAIESRFGGASRNLQQFNEKIKVFELLQSGHPFQAMALEMKLLADTMRDSQTDAERWSQFLGNAIQQMGSNIEQGFEGLVNGTITFAQLMKKIMFDLIASLAEQWGAYYLAIGIADLFWNPAKGAAELAAGAALMALAGVLHALGGASGASKASGGGAGAAGGASVGGGVSQNQGPTAHVIAFPTSGSLNSNQPIIIQLDRSLSKDLIEGKQVITKSMLRSATKNTDIGKAINKLAS